MERKRHWYAERLGVDGFYATAPGSAAREIEERHARERGLVLAEMKGVEAMVGLIAPSDDEKAAP